MENSESGVAGSSDITFVCKPTAAAWHGVDLSIRKKFGDILTTY